MNLIKPKYTEEMRTILAYILTMPEVTRHTFYKSVEGQNIIKGLELEAENDKTPKESSGDTRKWDEAELKKILQQLHEAGPEQREALLQLLPGPVLSVIMNRLKEPSMEKGQRGPVKGTPGYFQWVEKLRASRAAKKKTPDSSAGSGAGTGPVGPSKKEYGAEHKPGQPKKELGRYQKVGNRAGQSNGKPSGTSRGYEHFVRQIGEHGEIHDTPSGRKTQR